jgi:hypothetical protein
MHLTLVQISFWEAELTQGMIALRNIPAIIVTRAQFFQQLSDELPAPILMR